MEKLVETLKRYKSNKNKLSEPNVTAATLFVEDTVRVGSKIHAQFQDLKSELFSLHTDFDPDHFKGYLKQFRSINNWYQSTADIIESYFQLES